MCIRDRVFCGHQELNNDDPHDYGVNLLHDTDDRTPHEREHSPPTNGLTPPWLVDDIRFVACMCRSIDGLHKVVVVCQHIFSVDLSFFFQLLRVYPCFTTYLWSYSVLIT